MSTTNPVSGSNIPAAGLSNTPANMQINQADFLQLITAQMKDQNPLSPSDPTQFVTQLEGMSQVSAMQSMQTSMQASSIMNGTTLIGRSILAPGTQVTLATGGAAQTMPVNGRIPVESRPDLVQSDHNGLFASGTLGRYSKVLNSVIESRLGHGVEQESNGRVGEESNR